MFTQKVNTRQKRVDFVFIEGSLVRVIVDIQTLKDRTIKGMGELHDDVGYKGYHV
jgi:hypothetical protein